MSSKRVRSFDSACATVLEPWYSVDEKVEAVRFIGAQARDTALYVLFEALERFVAGSAVGIRIKGPESGSNLSPVAIEAARELAKRPHGAGIPLLRTVILDRSADLLLRQACVRGLGGVRDKQAWKLLLRLVSVCDGRRMAAAALDALLETVAGLDGDPQGQKAKDAILDRVSRHFVSLTWHDQVRGSRAGSAAAVLLKAYAEGAVFERLCRGLRRVREPKVFFRYSEVLEGRLSVRVAGLFMDRIEAPLERPEIIWRSGKALVGCCDSGIRTRLLKLDRRPSLWVRLCDWLNSERGFARREALDRLLREYSSFSTAPESVAPRFEAGVEAGGSPALLPEAESVPGSSFSELDGGFSRLSGSFSGTFSELDGTGSQAAGVFSKRVFSEKSIPDTGVS